LPVLVIAQAGDHFASFASFASLPTPCVALVIGFVVSFAPIVFALPAFAALVVVVAVFVERGRLPRVLREAKHVFLVLVFVLVPSNHVNLCARLYLL
jgi:hypothetical protein